MRFAHRRGRCQSSALTAFCHAPDVTREVMTYARSSATIGVRRMTGGRADACGEECGPVLGTAPSPAALSAGSGGLAVRSAHHHELPVAAGMHARARPGRADPPGAPARSTAHDL